MALSPGTRIGTFEISGPVGAGGMGEVYRARDTTLGRDVAIKVLPETFARDADRLARFEREAKLLASLNHPNIATIYGIEEGPAQAGPYVRAIVLEYVEGDTLADRIATTRRGGLPLDETLQIARQIVDALDAAHERGIAHRDLKPANIKIRPDGTVKVLDFGIAKAGASGSDTRPDAVTVESHATNAGIILGSPGYMSPEQARGQSTDKRTDIWAFGCVLFEMLTGRAPFEGATASDVIVATLTKEPDWPLVSDEVPDAIHRLLRRCLDRDPRRRLRDIGDAYADVHEAIDHPRATARATAAPARPVTFQRLTDRIGVSESPAVSPDGRMVAFVSPVSGRRQIWVRLLAGGAPLQITSDERDHAHPRWTADGTAIIYFAKPGPGEELGTVMEVSALGGPSRPLVSALNGADISHDGRRLALFEVRDGEAHLVTMSRDDGRVEDVAVGPKGYSCELPRWSPDGRWLAFHATRIGQLQERLFVVEASGRGEPRSVAHATAIKGASWLPDSSGLVFSSSAGSTLPYPPTCNLRRIQRDGTGDHPITFGDMSYVDPDVHASGKLLACRIRSQSDLWRFPVTGSPAENTSGAIRVTRQSGQVQTPSVSPDGSEIVYLSDNGGHGNLWVAKTDSSGRAKQITFEQDDSLLMGIPIWSPADNRIVFVRGSERLALWLVNSDGRGLRQLVARGIAPSWSPDGKWIYYSPLADNEQWRIEKVPVAGGAAVPVRNDDNHAPAVGHGVLHFVRRVGGATVEGWDWEFHRADPEDGPSEVLTRVSGYRSPVSQIFASASLSRDGRWLALPLMDGATCNLGVMPADGGEFQLVTDFGDRPTIIARQVSWAPDGKSIYAAVAEINGDIVLLDGLI